MDDLVIRGGTVADGTGTPPRTADVAIRGGRITAVGANLPRGHRELDADGLLVSPGWVDVHTHYDGHALWDPLLSPSSGHGVTTVVTGNCGVGIAPLRPADRDWTIALMEGVEDIPAEVLRRGLPWNWETFGQYLDAVEGVDRAVDVATQVPHAAVRVFVMGERGIDHEAVPSAEEIERMGEVVVDALTAGALGFSTSRSANHKASDGRLTPTLTAGEPELLGIAAAVGRLGTGVFEAVFDDADVAAEFALLRRICRISGRPMSVTTLQRPGQNPSSYREILRELERANADGLTMRGQVAARPVGLLVSLGGRVDPLLPSATYRALRPGDGTDLPALLRNTETRRRILAELDDAGTDVIARFPRAYALQDPPRWSDGPGPALTRLAADQGVSRLEAAYDVLASGRMVYVPVANYVDEDLAAVREMLVHPFTVPGLGDGGAHTTMIADFDFPTFQLAYWGRDAAEPDRLAPEWIVKRQCADTAALVGLHDRGILAPGMKADVNLIDLPRLNSTAPRITADLPGGGSRLVNDAAGYVATVVAGEVTFESGRHTGALPGALVRGARRPEERA